MDPQPLTTMFYLFGAVITGLALISLMRFGRSAPEACAVTGLSAAIVLALAGQVEGAGKVAVAMTAAAALLALAGRSKGG